MTTTEPQRGMSQAWHGRFDVWIVPVALLVVLWLVLAFSYGGFLPRQWLPAALVATAFALVAAAFSAYPRRPRRLSMVVLALFALYAAWSALSAAWSASADTAWTDTGRTFFYLLVLGLAMTYLTDAGARRALRYLLLGGALVLLAVVVWRLAAAGWGPAAAAQTKASANALFSEENRLMYPLSYPNNAAALFLILFWPLVWFAADPTERLPVRVAGLGVASGLLGLALLTQSRGGLWAFVITLVVLFILSPGRLRMLLYLAVPLALVVWFFPDLTRYLDDGPQALGYGSAVQAILLMTAAGAGASALIALAGRRVRLGPRTLTAIGAGVLLMLAVLLALEAVHFDRQVGGTAAWFGETWRSFTAEEEVQLPGASAGRFTTVSTSGRWDIWRVAWVDFTDHPLDGVGAGNFVFTYDRLRTNLRKPQQPHSEELRPLAETGLPGAVLLLGSVGVGLLAMLWPRFGASRAQFSRRRTGAAARPPVASAAPEDPALKVPEPRWGSDPRAWAWGTILAVSILYWWVHGAAEWFWQMPGVTIPMLLLLALGVAETDAYLAARAPSPLAADDHSVTPRSPSQPATPERRGAVDGPIGPLFRWLAVAVASLTFVALALPYLSLRFEDLSLQNIGRADGTAIAQTSMAARLRPTSAEPYSQRAEIYKDAARQAGLLAGTGGASAAVDNLALALGAREDAIVRDPASWALHYHAGLAASDLARAVESLGATPGPEPGVAPGSLADTPQTRAEVARLRGLTAQELRQRARVHLESARRRNPLSPLVQDALEALG